MSAPLPRDFPDQSIRDLLGKREHLGEFLRLVVPDLAAGFDVGRARRVNAEFMTARWGPRVSDILYEVPYREGNDKAPAVVAILVEHQTNVDPLIPLRTLVYAALYWETHWNQWEKSPAAERGRLRLPPLLPVVLHTGSRPWTARRSLADLFDGPPRLHAFGPAWHPIYWELSAHTADELIDADTAWAQVLAVIRAGDEPADEFGRVLAEVTARLSELRSARSVCWQELLHLLISWVTYSRPGEEVSRWTEVVRATEPEDAYRAEITTMAQTIAERLASEGAAKATRRAILRVGVRQLGEPSPAVIAALDGITDLDRLDRLLDRVLDAPSWDDLLATP